jgi:hypothetical protein
LFWIVKEVIDVSGTELGNELMAVVWVLQGMSKEKGRVEESSYLVETEA